eukprot:TRINITY_DN38472_c0_g2_i2.p2 TRINITY_DN38472_c0_g2~~TRINITY_DN38472_c0_g2_i2.p2  ORF type:complete len:128 (-),score=14.55 TRINITY_DN38472_c0_g2_i2:1091-1474(-)
MDNIIAGIPVDTTTSTTIKLKSDAAVFALAAADTAHILKSVTGTTVGALNLEFVQGNVAAADITVAAGANPTLAFANSKAAADLETVTPTAPAPTVTVSDSDKSCGTTTLAATEYKGIMGVTVSYLW